jgi:hypothetical protein
MSLENRIERQKERALAALEQSLGVVSQACKTAEISRGIFYKYYNEDPDFKKAVDEVQNITLDFAESSLLKQIKDGNTAATIFYLKTRGKERGYIESPLIGIDTFQPIQILLPRDTNNYPALDVQDIDYDGEEEDDA